MKLLQELLTLNESEYSKDDIEDQIDELVKDFKEHWKAIVPDLQDQINNMQLHTADPTKEDFESIVDKCFNKFYPKFASGDKTLNAYIVKNHKHDLDYAITDLILNMYPTKSVTNLILSMPRKK
jgi:hypothetical protein